jgi:hypothetical protein
MVKKEQNYEPESSSKETLDALNTMPGSMSSQFWTEYLADIKACDELPEKAPVGIIKNPSFLREFQYAFVITLLIMTTACEGISRFPESGASPSVQRDSVKLQPAEISLGYTCTSTDNKCKCKGVDDCIDMTADRVCKPGTVPTGPAGSSERSCEWDRL